ncbi:spermidine synthase [Nitriliruptoraceae bacterium ZYF776]|nr:spermidine synthase [Profundirhabdus halotolerans]
MPAFAAAALVFLSSGAVLVLEILAARLLAPYVGDTLETYTAIIGVILAGIAIGSWWGGRLSDRFDARHLIGPFLVVGGALAFLAIPIIDVFGSGMRGASATTTTILTALAFFAPAMVLSGVTPAVIKIQLSSIDETGSVVGRLSGLSTAGAIVGTFVTGFILVANIPSRPTVRVVAVLLILLGVASAVYLRGTSRLTTGTAVFVLVAGGGSFLASHPCEHESAYYCAFVVEDEERPSGRALWLDTLRHSYVDLEDPTYLEFAYTQLFGDAFTAIGPPGEAVDTLHIGGGGFTMPGYLRATRPGSDHVVLEVDPLLVEISQQELGLELGDDLEVLTGDARTSIRGVTEDRFDAVVMDAFGGVSVPWHLATREFLGEVEATMTDDGLHMANVIDYGPRDFLRAYVATTQDTFAHVAVVGPAERFGPRDVEGGGNVVVLASQAPLPLDELLDANAARGDDDVALVGEDLDAWVGDAPVLTDDFAPVDQLLTPLPTA